MNDITRTGLLGVLAEGALTHMPPEFWTKNVIFLDYPRGNLKIQALTQTEAL